MRSAENLGREWARERPARASKAKKRGSGAVAFFRISSNEPTQQSIESQRLRLKGFDRRSQQLGTSFHRAQNHQHTVAGRICGVEGLLLGRADGRERRLESETAAGRAARSLKSTRGSSGF